MASKPKYSGAIHSYLVPGKLTKLKDFAKYVNVKQLSYDMAEIFRADVNQYIPSRSGAIRDRGYVIHTSNSKKNPWFKLQYKNKPGIPYVMYQYMGKVWGPNFAIFEPIGIASYKAYDLKIQYEHIGWTSSKKHPRHPTNRNFRRRAATKVLDTGKVIKYAGYSHRNSQPKWMEYAFKNSKGLGSWREETNRYVERVYASVLTQQKQAETKKLSRQQARETKIRNQKLEQMLGVKPGTKIRTRLRKKNRS